MKIAFQAVCNTGTRHSCERQRKSVIQFTRLSK